MSNDRRVGGSNPVQTKSVVVSLGDLTDIASFKCAWKLGGDQTRWAKKSLHSNILVFDASNITIFGILH